MSEILKELEYYTSEEDEEEFDEEDYIDQEDQQSSPPSVDLTTLINNNSKTRTRKKKKKKKKTLQPRIEYINDISEKVKDEVTNTASTSFNFNRQKVLKLIKFITL